MKKILFLVFIAFVIMALSCACSSQKSENTKIEETKIESSSSQPESLLGKVEVIEKEDGTKVAKSEFGLEAEYSSENLMKLYDEYEQVKGKDEKKEAELLEKIQLILEAQIK